MEMRKCRNTNHPMRKPISAGSRSIKMKYATGGGKYPGMIQRGGPSGRTEGGEDKLAHANEEHHAAHKQLDLGCFFGADRVCSAEA
jgi:hypothetical protein